MWFNCETYLFYTNGLCKPGWFVSFQTFLFLSIRFYRKKYLKTHHEAQLLFRLTQMAALFGCYHTTSFKTNSLPYSRSQHSWKPAPLFRNQRNQKPEPHNMRNRLALCRVENRKVEHWSVIESATPKDQWKNKNGKF